MEKKSRSIILIGFMGCGKTTVGLQLSWRLKIPVEDTDKLIEKREGCTVADIFAREGEEAFRRKETELLRQISESKFTRILSVGGGTPVRAQNRELLKKCGTVVYLRVKPETVYERLKGDSTRPLLQCENPREKIKSLMMSRQEAYESCADVILDADEMSMEDLISRIADAVRGQY